MHCGCNASQNGPSRRILVRTGASELERLEGSVLLGLTSRPASYTHLIMCPEGAKACSLGLALFASPRHASSHESPRHDTRRQSALGTMSCRRPCRGLNSHGLPIPGGAASLCPRL